MTRRPLAAVGLLLGLGLATAGLAGCGMGAAGAAAEVGGQSITVEYLQKQVDSVVKMSGRTDLSATEVSNTQRAILVNLVEQRLIVDAAEGSDLEATEAEVSKVVAQIKEQRGAVPDEMLDGYARWNILTQKLGIKLLGKAPASQEDQAKAQELVGAELGKVAKRVGVKVNPRYGSWNGSTIAEGGELVKLTPAEGAAPEAPAGS